jgi:hypothetical protein
MPFIVLRADQKLDTIHPPIINGSFGATKNGRSGNAVITQNEAKLMDELNQTYNNMINRWVDGYGIPFGLVEMAHDAFGNRDSSFARAMSELVGPSASLADYLQAANEFDANDFAVMDRHGVDVQFVREMIAGHAGRLAHANGDRMIPALNETFCRLVEGMPVGTGAADIAIAWNRGWTTNSITNMPGSLNYVEPPYSPVEVG